MIRHYITDSLQVDGEESAQPGKPGPAWASLEPFLRRAIAQGVEFIQLREKHRTARELADLAHRAVELAAGSATRILINARADIALAAGAAGVHLPARSLPVSALRRIAPAGFVIGVSCHTLDEVRAAEDEGAGYAYFSPVFDSPGKGPAQGLAVLAAVCRAVHIPVLALGGITLENAELCLQHGAAGIAAIRLFQGGGE